LDRGTKLPSAPLPIDEARRLATLRAFEILDTEPERAFDELVALAASITDAPIALLSLVDESRQWFKARIGLDVSETPREYAFCSYAILGSAPLIVQDATTDARFNDNPLVTGDPGIRLYAGFPIEAGDGQRLGTLCVIDTRPRSLSAEQVTALRALAHQACGQLELRRALRQLTALREREQHVADRSLVTRASETFRVGQLLHKELATELSDIASTLQFCRSNSAVSSQQVAASLARAGERIAAAANDCRAVALRFRDFSLLSYGWLESVRADILRLQSKHDVQITLEEGEDPDLLLEYASAHRLAEFVHAALHAIVEHAGARQVRIVVSRHGSSLVLRIRHLGEQGEELNSPLHTNSGMHMLAAEMNSVVQKSYATPWIEHSLQVEMSSPIWAPRDPVFGPT
jgi:hypothetical protein